MKKLAMLFGALLVLCNMASANPKGGTFIGLNVGVPITNPTYNGFIEQMSDYFPTRGTGWAFGLELGYKQMLSQNFGLRYYVDYYYGSASGDKRAYVGFVSLTTKATIVQHHIAANIDALLYFTQRFGAYVGVGLGYQGYDPSYTFNGQSNFTGGTGTAVGPLSMPNHGLQGGLAIPINVGIMLDFGENSQLTLGAKIGTLGYDYELDANSKVGLSSYLVKLGYSYTF